MHGNPVRPSISFCNWLKKDEFLKFKVQQYQARLETLNNKFMHRNNGETEKNELFNKLHGLIAGQCNQRGMQTDVSVLTEQQCRAILQELHRTVTEPVRQLLNEPDHPFKTVTNPFYGERAKAKISVLHAYYLQEQKNRLQQEVSLPAIGPVGGSGASLEDELVTIIPSRNPARPTLPPIIYPLDFSEKNRSFLDKAIRDGMLTREIVVAAAQEYQLSTVIGSLSYLTREAVTLQEWQTANEPFESMKNLFGTDNGTERFSRVLRILARVYLKNYGNLTADDFDLKTHRYAVRNILAALNEDVILESPQPVSEFGSLSSLDILRRL